MQTRLIRYEFIDGKYKKIQSEVVEFICITGRQSAKIIDPSGKERIVRRSSLLDIPDYVLYPELRIKIKYEYDTESWKRSCYFD